MSPCCCCCYRSVFRAAAGCRPHQGAAFTELRVEDLRPVVLRDFKVGAVAMVLSCCGDGAAGVQEVQSDPRVARSTGRRPAGSKVVWS